jgi:type II secretory pathway pseudopilin PulG
MSPASSRADRGFSSVELAAAFALVGSLVAVAVPTFLRDVKSSRFVEPVDGLTALSTNAAGYATTHAGPATLPLAFPRAVGLTPLVPPHGHLAVDPAGTWSDPTWAALQFPVAGSGFAFADGAPHAFSFAFDSTPGSTRSTFKAHAHADLDGDGVLSTFEVSGYDTASEGAVVTPGMYVEAPLE